MTPRRMLQESDELLFWVEECLVQEIRIVPGWLDKALPGNEGFLQRLKQSLDDSPG